MYKRAAAAKQRAAEAEVAAKTRMGVKKEKYEGGQQKKRVERRIREGRGVWERERKRKRIQKRNKNMIQERKGRKKRKENREREQERGEWGRGRGSGR